MLLRSQAYEARLNTYSSRNIDTPLTNLYTAQTGVNPHCGHNKTEIIKKEIYNVRDIIDNIFN